MSASRNSALTNSTRCCSPTERSPTVASGSTASPYRSARASIWRRAVSKSRNAPLVTSLPKMMFSATVNTGMSWKCWWTMPMPRSMASPESSKCTCSPRTRMVPLSGRYSPNTMFIRVLLPAPFSPSRQWISPWFRVRLTLSLATTPGKVLVMPSTSSTGLAMLLPA